jgi:hypothetical protein
MPMILLVALGYFLKKKAIITDQYENVSSKLVFNLALPVTMFSTTARANMRVSITGEVWFFITVTSIMLICLGLIAHLVSVFLIKEKRTRGAFVQGAFRSNFVIIGYPILMSLFGEEVILPMTLVTVFLIPIVNVISVIVLTINNPDIQEIDYKKIAANIIKNPLILSILFGIVFSLMEIRIPVVIESTFASIRGLTTPLALINIGSMFVFSIQMKDKMIQLVCLFLKSFLYPLGCTTIGILLGFRDQYLAVLFIAIAAPSPPSGYVMSKLMHSDEVFSANNIVLSTVLSGFTIFIGITTMKYFGLI